MSNNKYLAWISLLLFSLSVLTILVSLFLGTVFSDFIKNPGIVFLAIGILSLLATVMGFMSFKAPQAKVGGIGGLVTLLLVLFIIPTGRETRVLPVQPEVSLQDQTQLTGIAQIDHIIDIALADSKEDELQLLQFSTLACTRADGLGGPPKCEGNEDEGSPVEVFPFLGPEGHHMRHSNVEDWEGIQVTDVYAVYRVSPQVYSEEAYPAGDYAIVFLTGNEQLYLTAQVTGGKIVRIDNNFGSPADIDLEQVAAEIILKPQR